MGEGAFFLLLGMTIGEGAFFRRLYSVRAVCDTCGSGDQIAEEMA